METWVPRQWRLGAQLAPRFPGGYPRSGLAEWGVEVLVPEEGADSILASWTVASGASPRFGPIGSWFGFVAFGVLLVPGLFRIHVQLQRAFPLSWVWALPCGASRFCSFSCL